MEWGSTIFSACASIANFSVRVCLYTSGMAGNTDLWCALQLGFHEKPNSTNGDANKVAVLRAMIDGSPSLCNTTLRCPRRRNGDTKRHVAFSFTPFSRRHVCSKHSSFHVFRNQDEQFVLCHFVIFVVIVIFRAIKLQRTTINRNKWVLVLSTRLLPLVSSKDSTYSLTRSTPSSMLGTSRLNMVFIFRPKQHWVV